MEEIAEQPSTIYTKVADMRRGADWFYWIASLGVINTLLVTYGGLADTLFGLGATRAVDQAFKQNVLDPVDPIGLLPNFGIAAVFALFGYFARKGNDRAFVIGMFLYILDAMITIAFRDLFAFSFHLVALFFIFKGLLASRKRFDPSV